MGKRSFKELAAGCVGTSKAPVPPSTSSVPRDTSTPSTAPDLAPSVSVVPSTAPSTAPSAKKSVRTSSSLVLVMPASDPKAARSSAPLVTSRSGEDARKKAKRKIQDTAGVDRRESKPRDGDGREPKRPRTDPPCSPVRVSQTMSRAGLRFLAFVNRVGHEPEEKIKKHKLRTDACAKGELAAKTEHNKYADKLEKRNKELEKAFGDNQRLRTENKERRVVENLEAAGKDASNSLSCLTSRNAQVTELKTKVGKKRDELKMAKALIVDLYEQFATARAKLEDELLSLITDVEAYAGDEEHFDKLMETLRECLDVVLPEFVKPPTPNRDVSLEKLVADAGVADVSGLHMFSESAGGLLQELRIDSARLLKDL
ncbi:hypothetical protein AALP_AA6G259400 [Arabis alpina]|uniref:Uncharacterized protein n=1 Tax=Arabis alpina TaxID=50452 RepID=A0A087GRR1_ARAAL|nr:hypothetical protein AALP_AA6G259400 [Arabis alpina]